MRGGHRFGAAIWRFFGGRLLTRDWGAVRACRPTPPAVAPPGDAAHRFAAAVRQYGLSAADLRQRHRYYAGRCYVLLGAAWFAVSFGATSARFTFGGGIAILAVLLALLFAAAAAQSAFRAWQIRERRLSAFAEWVRTPAGWWPPLVQGEIK